jgi:hypothetical protein
MATENYDWLLSQFPASLHDRVRNIAEDMRAVIDGCSPEGRAMLAQLADAFGAAAEEARHSRRLAHVAV